MKNAPAGPGRGGGEDVSDTQYLENIVKRIVEELKEKNCLSQDFQFLTKAEREIYFERHVDKFLKSCQETDQ